MITIKRVCTRCGGEAQVLVATPERDSLQSVFVGLMIEAVADSAPPIGPEDPCPHCGGPFGDDEGEA